MVWGGLGFRDLGRSFYGLGFYCILGVYMTSCSYEPRMFPSKTAMHGFSWLETTVTISLCLCL